MSRFSSCGCAGPSTCACISASPGMRNLPRPSMRCASAGILTDAVGPMAAMRPSRMITVWPVSTRSRSMGRTVTSTNANVPAARVSLAGARSWLPWEGAASAAVATDARNDVAMIAGRRGRVRRGMALSIGEMARRGRRSILLRALIARRCQPGSSGASGGFERSKNGVVRHASESSGVGRFSRLGRVLFRICFLRGTTVHHTTAYTLAAPVHDGPGAP